nr:transcriptional regulator [Streptomyces sp. SID5476]
MAEELRGLRARAGTEKLTLRRWSQLASVSPSALSRATSGESVPSASTVDALAKALGVSPKERAELQTLRAQAVRATATRETNESSRSDSPGITRRAEKDDAAAEVSLAELARRPRRILVAALREEAQKQLLVSLHTAAGAPSVREIADRTGLPRSTVHRALTGQSTAGAKDVADSLVAQLMSEGRDDWTAKIDSTFQYPTSPAEAPPLFRATSPGERMDAERAFSEFTDSLRRFRNLIAHGQVEADPLFRVQVMALAALVEERLAPADFKRPEIRPSEGEIRFNTEGEVEVMGPEGEWIELPDDPSWRRETHAGEQASGRRREA